MRHKMGRNNWCRITAIATAVIFSIIFPTMVAADVGWSSPNHVDTAGRIGSLSCVSTAFCIAVDSSGNYLAYDGQAWRLAAIGNGQTLNSISCVSATFCAGVTGAPGNFLTYNGTSWSSPALVDSTANLRSVSCLSNT